MVSPYRSEQPKQRFLRFREICEMLMIHQYTFRIMNEERNVSDLNEVAAHFFSDMAHVLQRHIVLEIAKLFDSPYAEIDGVDRYNIGIRLIAEEAQREGYMNDELKALCDRLYIFGDKPWIVRSRLIAHNDLATNFSPTSIPTWEKPEELDLFNSDLCELIQRLSVAHGLGHWDLVPNHIGDISSLLSFIRRHKKIGDSCA